MSGLKPLLCLAAGLVGLVGAAVWSRTGGRECWTVSLVAGESVEIPGGTLELRTFSVPKYASGKPRQFVSEVALCDDDGTTEAVISVNHPRRWGGLWIYQSDYDQVSEAETTLTIVRDGTLPLAAVSAIILVLGALWLCGRGSGDRFDSATRWGHRALPLVTLVPVAVVARVVLRADQVPALQSPLMAPHVGAYVASYLFLLFAAFGVGRRFMAVGFLMMTIGFVLGGVWGQLCWTNYWQNDPKELASLATWIVYFAYFFFRGSPLAEQVLRVVGAAMILFTATIVNFARVFHGLHSY